MCEAKSDNNVSSIFGMDRVNQSTFSNNQTQNLLLLDLIKQFETETRPNTNTRDASMNYCIGNAYDFLIAEEKRSPLECKRQNENMVDQIRSRSSTTSQILELLGKPVGLEEQRLVLERNTLNAVQILELLEKPVGRTGSDQLDLEFSQISTFMTNGLIPQKLELSRQLESAQSLISQLQRQLGMAKTNDHLLGSYRQPFAIEQVMKPSQTIVCQSHNSTQSCEMYEHLLRQILKDSFSPQPSLGVQVAQSPQQSWTSFKSDEPKYHHQHDTLSNQLQDLLQRTNLASQSKS
jgi:hypothetical protein